MPESRAIVAIVLLNYNGRDDTIACLESLVRLRGPARTVVLVVDNASADGSIDAFSVWACTRGLSCRRLAEAEASSFVPASEDWLVLISAARNAGFAAGNNLALRSCLAWASHVWVLNNDTVAEPDSLWRLLRHDAASGVSIIGSTIVEYNDPRMIQMAAGSWYRPVLTMTVPALRGRQAADAVADNMRLPRPLDMISGCSMFMRISVLQTVGLFDDIFFLFYEETDFCTRAKRKGIGLEWCSESVVIHKGGGAIGSRSGANPNKSALAEYHSTLSALRYAKKNTPLLLVPAMVSRLLLKTVLLVTRRDWRLFSPLIRAYADFVVRCPAGV